MIRALLARLGLVATLVLMPFLPAAAQDKPPNGWIILATTTSTVDSGLLDVLVPKFREKTGIGVKTIGIGSGAALEMGSRGDADAVLSHAPTAERTYVRRGDLVDGVLVMHNDFLLVGSPADPLGLKTCKTIKEAMAKIGAAGGFVSRGDGSGTHKMELELWKAAGIDPKTVKKREETGQGMGATLNIADQRAAYTLVDRGTYLALRKKLSLVPVFEGDPTLLNIYHAYVVNPKTHPGIRARQAKALVEFMVNAETQALIGEFRKTEFGESLFVPDGGKSEEELVKK